jgi:hypothetical protein
MHPWMPLEINVALKVLAESQRKLSRHLKWIKRTGGVRIWGPTRRIVLALDADQSSQVFFRPNRLEETQWLSTEHGDQEAR